MIVIIDYGMGNVGSISNMIKKLGKDSITSADTNTVKRASRLILPGVGAFDNGMRNLRASGLLPVLNEKILEEKTPVLGICLGMQLMTRRSEEGVTEGLGWIDAEILRFSFKDPAIRLKVPHMGWNHAKIVKDNALFQNMDENSRFYFVHSYHVVCNRPEDILATTVYGYEFVSAVNRGNIYGVQFHPEKSHKFGMCLMKNFVERV